MKLIDILKEIGDAEFGKIMFGDKNDPPEFAKLQKAKPGSEPDTPDEKKLLNLLKRWVGTPENVMGDLYKMSDKLKALSKYYPKILKPKTPNGTIVYRGLKSVSPQIDAQIKASKPEDWIKAGRLYVLTTPIKYVPRSDIQSWTTNRSTATMFFGESGALMTKQTDEFLLNQDAITVLYPLSEDEVLHFGKDYNQGNVYVILDMISYMARKYQKKLDKAKVVSDKSADLDMKSIVK